MAVKYKLALLIPAHNETLSIEQAIKSAVASGQPRRDIFVVDDASTDDTAAIATRLLGRGNVVTTQRLGKAGAIGFASRHFELTRRYHWIHIADADTLYGQDYFRIFRRRLNRKFAAATGYVCSLKGNWISRYRAYIYTVALQISRRIQKAGNIIPVIPGPTACFRSDVFGQLDFNDSLTEDFAVTLQIHRRGLGRILYLPAAKVYTQDPKSLKDFIKKERRWFRGFFQVVRRDGVGRKASKIDAYLSYMALSTIAGFALLALLPILVLTDPVWAAAYFLLDTATFGLSVLVVAAIARRPDIVPAFPFFLLLRAIETVLFFTAFIEVMLLNRYLSGGGAWQTEGRRYRLNFGKR